MVELKGKDPRYLKGDTNPRHLIMIAVGTGNKYCRNCDYLYLPKFLHPALSKCVIFKEPLKVDDRLGCERCQSCRDAERLIQETKQVARKEGEDIAFFRANGTRERKSDQLNMRV
jgi:hypothetical protein